MCRVDLEAAADRGALADRVGLADLVAVGRRARTGVAAVPTGNRAVREGGASEGHQTASHIEA